MMARREVAEYLSFERLQANAPAEGEKVH
jgi:hypothetical protein